MNFQSLDGDKSIPEIPEWISGNYDAVFAWEKIWSLSDVEESDYLSIANLCKTFADMRDLQRRIDVGVEHRTILNNNGKTRQNNPILIQLDGLRKEFNEESAKFGMNPVARKRMIAESVSSGDTLLEGISIVSDGFKSLLGEKFSEDMLFPDDDIDDDNDESGEEEDLK